MERWKFGLIIAVIAAIAVYAINSTAQRQQQQQDTQQGEQLNKTIQAKFDENFQRQNFLGNTTVAQVLNVTREIDKLLVERTPRFDKIEALLNASIENQRTIISNQYRYSLPENLNVSGISNESR